MAETLDLDGVDLDGVDLDGVDLDGVDLDGVDLDGVDLDGVAAGVCKQHSWYKHLPLEPVRRYIAPIWNTVQKRPVMSDWSLWTESNLKKLSTSHWDVVSAHPVFVNCFLRGLEEPISTGSAPRVRGLIGMPAGLTEWVRDHYPVEFSEIENPRDIRDAFAHEYAADCGYRNPGPHPAMVKVIVAEHTHQLEQLKRAAHHVARALLAVN